MGEQLAFKDVFADVTRKATKIPAKEYQPKGINPIIDQGQSAIAGYSDVSDGLFTDVPAIVFGDHTCAIKYADTPFFIGADGTKILRQVRNDNPRFLFHALKYYAANLPGSKEYTRHFKWLKECSFIIPDYEHQCQIAESFDTIQDEIALVKRILAKADELIQSRFVEMFESQPTCALFDYCDFYSGGTPSKKNPEYWDGSLPWFSPKDIKSPMLWDSIDHVNDEITEKTNLKLIPEDTVVVVVRGMILAHDVPVAIVKTAATINQDLKAMIPKRECNAVFLASALRNQEKMLLAETGQSAHGTKKLDTDVLGSVAVPNAPLALQNEFAEFVTQVESLKATTRQQLDRLNALYDSLAQRYFAE